MRSGYRGAAAVAEAAAGGQRLSAAGAEDAAGGGGGGLLRRPQDAVLLRLDLLQAGVQLGNLLLGASLRRFFKVCIQARRYNSA